MGWLREMIRLAVFSDDMLGDPYIFRFIHRRYPRQPKPPQAVYPDFDGKQGSLKKLRGTQAELDELLHTFPYGFKKKR